MTFSDIAIADAPVTIPQLAQALGCSRRTVQRAVRRGDLPAWRAGERHLRVAPDAARAFIRSRIVKTEVGR